MKSAATSTSAALLLVCTAFCPGLLARSNAEVLVASQGSIYLSEINYDWSMNRVYAQQKWSGKYWSMDGTVDGIYDDYFQLEQGDDVINVYYDPLNQSIVNKVIQLRQGSRVRVSGVLTLKSGWFGKSLSIRASRILIR